MVDKTIRQRTRIALAAQHPDEKVRLTNALRYPDTELSEPIPEHAIPGRPAKPSLVSPRELQHRSLGNPQGRAILLHAIAHIEFNAINLALDIVQRFHETTDEFVHDWLTVATEEAYHFTLLRQHLLSYGHDYGDFPAHDGLWEMAEKTHGDLLARLALVPRILEARGLDVSPGMRDKLKQAGDDRAAEILDIILHDEIGHVAIGNKWFRFYCEQRCLEPVSTFETLWTQHDGPQPRAPFNVDARLQAGFEPAEIDWLIKKSETYSR